MCARRILGLITVVFAMTVWPALRAAEPVPESRLILAVYDSADGSFRDSNTHRMAQVVFDHLGLILAPRDIRMGLPTHEEMAAYRGVFAWLTRKSQANPEGYLEWLAEECRRGRYVVVWGHLGAYINGNGKAVNAEALRQLYALWGFESNGRLIENDFSLEKAEAEPDMMGFEHPLELGISDFVRCRPTDPAAVDVYLSVQERGTEHPPSSVVARHPHGGFALQHFIFYADPRTGRRQWILNPFEFLRACFRVDEMPAVDLTTLNGCRMLYAHIDGDGSMVQSQPASGAIAAEVIMDKIVTQYRIPVTVGVVEGEVIKSSTTKWVKNRPRMVELFRNLLALDNVEAASHACTQPLDWEHGLSRIVIPGISRRPKNRDEDKFVQRLGHPEAGLYIAEPDAWVKREILGSIEYINKDLATTDEQCRLFLWTGDRRPTLIALQMLAGSKLLNLNGGDSVFDPLHPSVSALAPAYLRVGSYTQYYASAASEDAYTDSWTRNFAGYRHAIETFTRSGYPRRLKPINIHYHFYSAQHHASLNALRQVHDYCKPLDLSPVFAGDYVEILRNSMEIKLVRNDRGWSWSNARNCRTLRWDNQKDLPDLEHSEGVIGYYHDPDLHSLYVHLDGHGQGRIAFSEAPKNPIHVSRASGYIHDWQRSGEAVSCSFVSHGSSWIELDGCRPNSTYTVKINGNEHKVISRNDRLRLVFDGQQFTKNLKIVIVPGKSL